MSSTTAAALPTQQQSASTQMEHDEKIPAAVSSQDTEEYVSEDEEQHQDFSNVAGSQSCLSQELQVAAFSQDSSAVAMTSTDFTPSILLEEKTANNSNNKSSSADSLTTNNTPAAAAAEARSENAPSALEPTASSTASAKENNSYNDNMKQEPKKPESKNNQETHEFLEFAKAAKRKAGKNPKTPKIKTTSPNESSQASVKDFGTLLSAVEIFTSQEDGDDYKFSQEETLQNDPILQQANNSDNGIQEDSQEGVRQLLQSSSDQSDAEAEAKKEQPQPELSKKRKRKGDNEKSRQQVNAQRAADLAKRTITDPDLAKRLLLSMALTRENPRSPPAELPGKGHMLISGFFWAKYPPLEVSYFCCW